MTTPTFGFPFPAPSDLVRNGWENIRDLAEGVDGYLSGGFVYAGTRYFFSDGNFEKDDPFDDGNPDGLVVRAVRVRMVGGGGGGGRIRPGDTLGPGGGGGGGYSEKFYGPSDVAAFDASEQVTRGAGGAGATDDNGEDGGTSQFRTQTATGGAGASQAGRGATPREGGSGANADIVINGGHGGYGFTLSADARGQVTGFGGASALAGSTNIAALANNTSDAADGLLYGGGGSGAMGRGTFSDTDGGNGAPGIVIIDVFV